MEGFEGGVFGLDGVDFGDYANNGISSSDTRATYLMA